MLELKKYLDISDKKKLQMLEIKASFNSMGFRLGIKNASYIDLVVNELPQYNNPAGRNKIKNVWGLRQTDEKILAAFAIILQNISNE